MENTSNYKRILGFITLAAGCAAAACMYFAAITVEYHFEVFSEPTLLLQFAHNYKSAYWFLLSDMAGYYLLLLPAIFYLHQQYKYRSPWVPLLSFSGLAYVLTGAIGAAVLAATWPGLMEQYTSAPEADKQSITLIFNTITLAVTKGLWNILEVIFAGAWWIGFGVLLRRDYKILGLLSIVAGAACLLDSFGTIIDAPIIAEIGVNVYLLAGIVWPTMLGVHLIRKSNTEFRADSVASFSINVNRDSYVEA